MTLLTIMLVVEQIVLKKTKTIKTHNQIIVILLLMVLVVILKKAYDLELTFCRVSKT